MVVNLKWINKKNKPEIGNILLKLVNALTKFQNIENTPYKKNNNIVFIIIR